MFTKSNRRPLIVAHRGSAGEAPENTLAAFKLALEQKCDAVELDIHLSKDNQLVVCHDSTIDRTTDRTGAIREMTVQELKEADAGSWFDAKYAGERLPLLGEVLDILPESILINIEVKHSYDGEIEPVLIDFLRKHNAINRVEVSSFYHKSLVNLKQREPELRIGLLYGVDFANHVKTAEAAGVPVYALHPRFDRIEPCDIQEAVQDGMQVFTYTINDKERMKQAIESGVTGIITDYPGLLWEILNAN